MGVAVARVEVGSACCLVGTTQRLQLTRAEPVSTAPTRVMAVSTNTGTDHHWTRRSIGVSL
jgi:hypothetical protein